MKTAERAEKPLKIVDSSLYGENINKRIIHAS